MLLTLPMSSVNCERGFSVMKLIKTRLRNSLKQDTLEHVMMIAIEGPEMKKFNFQNCIKKYGEIG